MSQEEDDLMSFLYACPVGLIEFDPSGRIGMINPHAMKLLMPLAVCGWPENLFGTLERQAPELRNIVGAFTPDHGMIREGHRIYLDLGEPKRDSRPTVLSCTLTRLDTKRYMATLSDVSTQVLQEHRLNQADTWFSALIDEINDYALLTLNGDGKVKWVNQSFTGQTGRPSECVVGKPIDEILQGGWLDDGHGLSLEDQFNVATRDGWVLQEGWEKRANGDRYWCQRLIIAREDEDGDPGTPAYSMVLRDVPPRDGNSPDLIGMLTQDHLTGATNRMQLQKALRRESIKWRQVRQSVSLIMLDLDHFKEINDEHGHPAGDDILCEVARVGRSALPPGGTFCRYGGEEFAVLLPNLNLTGASSTAEKIRALISNLSVGDAGIKVTASFGCAEISEVNGSIEALIELADNRLYDAKRSGRDRVLAVTA